MEGLSLFTDSQKEEQMIQQQSHFWTLEYFSPPLLNKWTLVSLKNFGESSAKIGSPATVKMQNGRTSLWTDLRRNGWNLGPNLPGLNFRFILFPILIGKALFSLLSIID